MTQTSLQTLSVGNIIRTAFQLYRDRFALYFGIVVRAGLWLSIPSLIFQILLLLSFGQLSLSLLGLAIPIGFLLSLFGIAKYITNLALISRLAFETLSARPETVKEASRHVFPKLWRFLRAFCLTFFLNNGVYSGLSIIAVTGFFVGNLWEPISRNIIIWIAFWSILIAAILTGAVFLLRMIIRLSFIEIHLVIEDNVTAVQSLSRSWQLTKVNGDRIVLIFLVAGLITFPVQIIGIYSSAPIQNALIMLLGNDNKSVAFLAFISLITYAIKLIIIASPIPFWQSLKSTIYHDLRSRK